MVKKSVLSYICVNCCTWVSDRHHGGQERMHERAPQPPWLPPNPEPCSAWGGQELWPDSGDMEKIHHYCQLSGVCASMIMATWAFALRTV